MKKMRKLVSLLLAGALLATGCAPAPASKAAALFAKPGTYTASAPATTGI